MAQKLPWYGYCAYVENARFWYYFRYCRAVEDHLCCILVSTDSVVNCVKRWPMSRDFCNCEIFARNIRELWTQCNVDFFCQRSACVYMLCLNDHTKLWTRWNRNIILKLKLDWHFALQLKLHSSLSRTFNVKRCTFIDKHLEASYLICSKRTRFAFKLHLVHIYQRLTTKRSFRTRVLVFAAIGNKYFIRRSIGSIVSEAHEN